MFQLKMISLQTANLMKIFLKNEIFWNEISLKNVRFMYINFVNESEIIG